MLMERQNNITHKRQGYIVSLKLNPVFSKHKNEANFTKKNGVNDLICHKWLQFKWLQDFLPSFLYLGKYIKGISRLTI